MKIYVAGRITGNHNYKAEFAKAELKLVEEGNIVLNPSILPFGLEQEEYMSICLPMLQVCDAVYLLRGWESSKGANIEKAFAEQLGTMVIFEPG